MQRLRQWEKGSVAGRRGKVRGKEGVYVPSVLVDLVVNVSYARKASWVPVEVACGAGDVGFEDFVTGG